MKRKTTINEKKKQLQYKFIPKLFFELHITIVQFLRAVPLNNTI